MKCYNFFNKEPSNKMENGLLYWLKIDTIICLFSMLMGWLISKNIGKKIISLLKTEKTAMTDMAGAVKVIIQELI